MKVFKRRSDRKRYPFGGWCVGICVFILLALEAFGDGDFPWSRLSALAKNKASIWHSKVKCNAKTLLQTESSKTLTPPCCVVLYKTQTICFTFLQLSLLHSRTFLLSEVLPSIQNQDHLTKSWNQHVLPDAALPWDPLVPEAELPVNILHSPFNKLSL